MNSVTQHSLPKAPRHADAIAVRTLVAEELVLLRRLARLPRGDALALIAGALMVLSEAATPEEAYRRWLEAREIPPATASRYFTTA
jgi:hypothetical protein